MELTKVLLLNVITLLTSATAGAQVAADLVAGNQIPQGSAFGPHTPSGVVIIGSNLWAGDEAQGLRHYKPVDPNNADPINHGQLMFDIFPDWSMGGGTACIPWCSVGQIAQDGTTRAYLAIWNHAKGQPGSFGGPGVWLVQFQSAFGPFSPFEGATQVAPAFGLSGDLPTATALGPDSKLYVGFLKTGNIKRITNPSQINPTPETQSVESVGTTPNGRSMRSMAFLGGDLYIGTDQGLAVVRNAANCIGNQSGCGNAVLVQDGNVGSAHVAVTSDGVSKLYFSVNGSVLRYTPADGRLAIVSTGFLFVGGHTNTLTIDAFGNLWIGDDTTDGTINFTGRLWRIPAARLNSIP